MPAISEGTRKQEELKLFHGFGPHQFLQTYRSKIKWSIVYVLE
jgi:hypothetical protein